MFCVDALFVYYLYHCICSLVLLYLEDAARALVYVYLIIHGLLLSASAVACCSVQSLGMCHAIAAALSVSYFVSKNLFTVYSVVSFPWRGKHYIVCLNIVSLSTLSLSTLSVSTLSVSKGASPPRVYIPTVLLLRCIACLVFCFFVFFCVYLHLLPQALCGY